MNSTPSMVLVRLLINNGGHVYARTQEVGVGTLSLIRRGLDGARFEGRVGYRIDIGHGLETVFHVEEAVR